MKITRKDHSGLTNLPPVPPLDLCLYHWSPTNNRKRIEHRGLLTHQKTLQGDWRPPYICLSDDPMLAWTLSGNMWPDIKSWDLWMVFMPNQTSFDHYEIITDTYRNSEKVYVKEYRVYTRIFKRDLLYVATRKNN